MPAEKLLPGRNPLSPWRRWWPNRLACGVFVLVLLTLALWYSWIAARTPNQLEVMVSSDRPTTMRVDYVDGSNPGGIQTAIYRLVAGDSQKVHLPVSVDRLSSLRLHPSEGPIVMQLGAMRIRSGVPGLFGHRTIHTLDPGDWQPLRQIDELAREDATVRIVVGEDATDPCLGITPSAPLRLGTDLVAPGSQFGLCALGWLLLWLVGMEAGRRLLPFLPAAQAWYRAQTSPRNSLGSFHGVVLPLAGVALVLFLREPGFFVRPQLWAEDGKVLFSEARLYGWSTLWLPHPGYYILAQRLVACVADHLPALVAPWLYCYAALAYTLLAAWYCLRARLDDLLDQPGRIALALAIVLVPQGGEVQMKLIGCQWMLMSILPILILQEQPHRPGQAVTDILGLLFAGLTGPYIVLYAPLFLLRLRKAAGGWSRYNLGLVTLAGSLALVQAVRIWLTPQPPTVMNSHPDAWINELMFILPGNLFFGEMVPPYLGRAFYVLSPLALLLLAWAIVRGERKRMWAALALCGCGGIAYAAGIRAVAPNLDIGPFRAGDRYFLPIYTAAMWLGVLYYYDASKKLRTASAIALAMMLMSSASHFKGTEWPDLRWSNYAQRLDAGEAVECSNLPDWNIVIPARR